MRFLLLNKSAVFDNLLVAVIVLSIVGYPLISPISVLLDIPNRAISVPFRAIILIFSLLIIFINFKKRLSIRGGFVWCFWWLFWVLYISRVILDTFTNTYIMRLSPLEYFAYSVGTGLIPAVAVATRFTEGISYKSHNCIVKVSIAAALLSITYIVFTSGVSSITELASVRRGFSTLSAISLGHLGALLVLLATWRISIGRYNSLFVVFNSVLICIFGTVILLAASSKGPVVPIILIMPIFFVLAIKRLTKRYPLVLIGAGFILTIALSWFYVNSDDFFLIKRIESSLLGMGSSDQVRLDLYKQSITLFLENPLFGAGIEPLGMYPHNIVLEGFLVFGILSGLCLLVLLISSFLIAVRLLFIGSFHSWVSIIYIQVVTGLMFSGALYDPNGQWVLMSILISHHRILKINFTALCVCPAEKTKYKKLGFA